MSDCLFCQFAKKEKPKEFVDENNLVMVFADIHPVAPVHLLIVPKKHIKEFIKFDEQDKIIWEELEKMVKKMIKKYQLESRGYRIVCNGGGAQLIDHFHIHLMGEITAKKKL